jgi:hypothetical protein
VTPLDDVEEPTVAELAAIDTTPTNGSVAHTCKECGAAVNPPKTWCSEKCRRRHRSRLERDRRITIGNGKSSVVADHAVPVSSGALVGHVEALCHAFGRGSEVQIRTASLIVSFRSSMGEP